MCIIFYYFFLHVANAILGLKKTIDNVDDMTNTTGASCGDGLTTATQKVRERERHMKVSTLPG